MCLLLIQGGCLCYPTSLCCSQDMGTFRFWKTSLGHVSWLGAYVSVWELLFCDRSILRCVSFVYAFFGRRLGKLCFGNSVLGWTIPLTVVAMYLLLSWHRWEKRLLIKRLWLNNRNLLISRIPEHFLLYFSEQYWGCYGFYSSGFTRVFALGH